MSDLEEENTIAFERLLARKEIEEKGKQGRYRYYADLRGNKYGWYVSRQSDGKFHAFIYNARTGKSKTRIFARKVKAKRWLNRKCSKSITQQRRVIEARKERKMILESQKPKMTEQQKAIQKSESMIKHYNILQAKIQSKIKGLVTRSKTYRKRMKYHERKILSLQSPLEVPTPSI